MTGEQWMLTAEALTRATKRARIAEEKLEAVNEWLKKEFVMSSVNPPWYTKRIRQLSDIMEVSE